MSNQKIIAIDPGASGGIAFFDGKSTWLHNLGTISELIELLEPLRMDPYEVYLEDLVKYTGRNMPSSSMAIYASSWGAIKGVVQALHFRMHMVRPQEWQKELSLGTSKGMTKTAWKNKLKARAEELNPALKISLKTADAVLILEYAKRQIV